jgi:two-component system response regulator VicR
MNTKAHLLYVEDDESLSFVTCDHLELQGYRITHCISGRTALEAVNNQIFDLCILDVMLPEMDGFELAENIRRQNAHIPILFLTAKSLKEDKIQGLRLGADDYITKPFSIEELILKIEIFLRRSKVMPSEALSTTPYIQLGCYAFDYKNLTLRTANDTKRLTQKEADLLRFLYEHKNQVVKRSTILEQLWGEDDYFLGRSLDVFISRLRKYLRLEAGLRIENIHGVGFCFHFPADAA